MTQQAKRNFGYNCDVSKLSGDIEEGPEALQWKEEKRVGDALNGEHIR